MQQKLDREERLIEQQQKDISNITTELGSLKVTLIGIDGNNGMRSQIKELTKEVKEIKSCFNEFLLEHKEINSENSKNCFIFCTKKELEESEGKILKTVDEFKQTLDKEEKYREEDRIERKRHLENLKTSRWMVISSLVGIFVSSILTYLN